MSNSSISFSFLRKSGTAATLAVGFLCEMEGMTVTCIGLGLLFVLMTVQKLER